MCVLSVRAKILPHAGSLQSLCLCVQNFTSCGFSAIIAIAMDTNVDTSLIEFTLLV